MTVYYCPECDVTDTYRRRPTQPPDCLECGCQMELDEDGDYEEEYYDDRDEIQFAHPVSNSALRAATAANPRDLPCPTCGRPDRLTPADRALGYQCDACADRDERGGY